MNVICVYISFVFLPVVSFQNLQCFRVQFTSDSFVMENFVAGHLLCSVSSFFVESIAEPVFSVSFLSALSSVTMAL